MTSVHSYLYPHNPLYWHLMLMYQVLFLCIEFKNAGNTTNILKKRK